MNLELTAKVFGITNVPEPTIEDIGTDRSVQDVLLFEPCNLKVFAVEVLDNDQLTKSKFNAEIII